MSFKSVLKKIGGVAPLLTSILPIPGASIAGDLIAGALGVENSPHAIATAVNTDPQALQKIAQVEAENKAELQKMLIQLEMVKIQEKTKQYEEDTKRISSVNQTMRSEQKSEHWLQYSWRPIWGIASAVAFVAVVIQAMMLSWRAVTLGDMNAMQMIPQLVASFTSLFAIAAAILGVASWHRGKEKRIVAGEQPTDGMLSALAGRIRGNP